MNVFDKNITYLEKRERINLHINWTKPSFADEADEYFGNSFTKEYLADKGIMFNDIVDVKKFLDNGTGKQLEIKDIKKKKITNMTLSQKEFKKELKEPGYADNYMRIQDELLGSGTTSLPMPIILDFGDEYYGFAGNRRMNLAFAHDIPVTFWVVNARNE